MLRYDLYVADSEARGELESMARRGCRAHDAGESGWDVERYREHKDRPSAGIGRSGKPKAMARMMCLVLMYWGWILGDEGAEDAAWLVETERSGRQRDQRCNCHLKPSPKAFTKR